MPDTAVTIEALKRLRTQVPAEDAEYIDRAAPGDSRPWQWPARLQLLVAADQRPRLLLHGPIGVGKTTELWRWKRLLDHRAVLVEIGPVSDPWSVPATLLGAMPHRPADVEPGRGTVDVSTLAKSDPRRSRDRQIWERLWSDANGSNRQPPPILLVDGLDLIPVERVREFFGPGTPLVLPGMPPVVYVAPHALVTVNPAADRDASFEAVHLAPFPVVREDASVDLAVCDWMIDGLLARLKGLPIRVDRELRKYMAVASGGVPRDALRILRTALLSSAGRPEVDMRAVYEGSRELRQDIEQSLALDEQEELKTGRTRPMESLVRKNAMLVYEGEKRRYTLIHPVLRLPAQQ